MRNLLLPALLCASLLSAQDKPAPVRLKQVRVSPACTLTQDLGICQVKIAFSRPAVKGRTLWGEKGLVPNGQVWRTGANAATVITFSHPAKVAGKDVPAGSYGFFAIPGEKTWTLMLSKKSDQWGAYAYKAEDDQLRWEATPQAGPFQEWLDYRVTPTGLGSATLELGWEKLRITFPIEFDLKGLYWAHLEETLGKAPDTDWTPWYQAAKYCQEQGIEAVKAMAWIDKSLKAKEGFQNHETKARLLKAAGKMPEAIVHLQKAIDLSKPGDAPKEYTDNLEKELTAWKTAK